MTNHLRTVLEDARPTIEAALLQAEAELEQLDARREELLALIARARAALGLEPVDVQPAFATDRQLTLHEAIEVVLRDHGNAWMTPREIADEVNRRGLYRMRDGGPVDVGQVHARTKNYSARFLKSDGRIRLTTTETP